MKTITFVTWLAAVSTSALAPAAPLTRAIFATYQGVEQNAGFLSYDPDVVVETPFPQGYFAVTAISFTSPASGTVFTLADFSPQFLGATAAYAPDLPRDGFAMTFGGVLAAADATNIGPLQLRPGGFGSFPGVSFTPFRPFQNPFPPPYDPDSLDPFWTEISATDIPWETFRVQVPEPSALALAGLATVMVGLFRRSNLLVRIAPLRGRS